MGLFSSPADKYSPEEKQISSDVVRRLVSQGNVSTLSQTEEKLIEEEIIARRGSDGSISMRQIYQVLTKLEQGNNISEFDRKKILQIFEEYFR